MLSRDQIVSLLRGKPEKARKKMAGFTVQDLIDVLVCGESAARSYVRVLLRRGLVELLGTEQRFRIDGKPYECPLYQFTKLAVTTAHSVAALRDRGDKAKKAVKKEARPRASPVPRRSGGGRKKVSRRPDRTGG